MVCMMLYIYGGLLCVIWSFNIFQIVKTNVQFRLQLMTHNRERNVRNIEIGILLRKGIRALLIEKRVLTEIDSILRIECPIQLV